MQNAWLVGFNKANVIKKAQIKKLVDVKKKP